MSTKALSLTRADLKALGDVRMVREDTPLLSIHYIQGEEGLKYSCVVSKKVTVSAVGRNLLKRRCREIIREFASGSSLKGSVIIRLKSRAKDVSFQNLRAESIALLRRLETRYNTPQ